MVTGDNRWWLVVADGGWRQLVVVSVTHTLLAHDTHTHTKSDTHTHTHTHTHVHTQKCKHTHTHTYKQKIHNTSHFEMSRLNLFASRNMPSMLLTLDTSHFDMSRLNAFAP